MSQLKIIIGNKTYSSWSLRGWLAVMHTGLPFEEVLLQLDTPNFYTEIDKYSPARRVPTLLDGDIAVWDSAAIIDYCARIAPEKYWWPEDKAAYGHARSIFNEMHSGFTEIRTHMPMNLRDKWGGLSFSDALQKDIDRIEALFTECLQKYGKGGSFLFGDFSAADMMYTPVVTRLDTYGVPLGPIAQNYVNAVLDYVPFKRWKDAAMLETEIVEIDQLAHNISELG